MSIQQGKVQFRMAAVLSIGLGYQPAQVAVPHPRFGQQGEVPAVGQGGLAADYRLYSGVVTGFGKLHGPAEIVVVGDGQGFIAKTGGLPDHLSNRRGPFLEAVIGVQVKLGVGYCSCPLPAPLAADKVFEQAGNGPVFQGDAVVDARYRLLPPPLVVDAPDVQDLRDPAPLI